MSLGSTVLGDAYVNIMGETSKLEQAFAKAQSMAKGFVTNIGKTIAVGVGAALATAVGTAVAGVWAWAKEEQSVKDLESSIRMLGGSVDKLVPKYEKVISQIQQNTTIGDDATRSAMAYAAAMGAPVDRLDDLAIAAVGLSARLKIGLQGAMMVLVRSMKSGRFDIFSRYGLQLDKTMTAQEKLNEVMKFATAGFQKQVEMADTLSGRLNQLKNNFGDLMETLGKKIAEKFQLKEIVDELSKRLYQIVSVFSKVIESIKPAEINLQKIGDRFTEIAKNIMAFVLALPGIWKAFRENISFGNLILVIWEGLKGAAFNFIEMIKDGFYTLEPIFLALSQILMQEIRKELSEVRVMGHPLMEPVAGIRSEHLMRFGLAESNKRLKESKESIEKDWVDLFEKLKIVAKGGTQETISAMVDAIKEKKDFVDNLFGTYSTTESLPSMGADPMKLGGDGGVTNQVSGFVAWYQKMQQSTQMSEAEKQLLKVQQKTADNTSKLEEYARRALMRGVDTGPLWVPA